MVKQPNRAKGADSCDLAIVGGGLAGGLIALAVHRARPDLTLRLIEAQPVFGGNHRWSWFEGDLDEAGTALLNAFHHIEWHSGHQVRFPGFARHLSGDYRSLASADFDSGLRRMLPQDALCCGFRVAELNESGVTLESGRRIAAKRVIDCRDFAPSRHLRGGWQIFVGHHVRTAKPHGLDAPIIMDADVAQHGAYRFVYSLPLSENEIFVEDTYYADDPALDPAVLSQRIAEYLTRQGWEGDIIAREAGVLPVITGGDAGAHRASRAIPGVALAGAGGLFTHPLTSYTLPFAAANALAVARHADLPGPELAKLLDRRAQNHWRATRFYRALGRMLFGAARPEERWRIFARFYHLRQPLIARFYAGRSTAVDKLRLLAGKPPVAIGRGLAALLGKGVPLGKEEVR